MLRVPRLQYGGDSPALSSSQDHASTVPSDRSLGVGCMPVTKLEASMSFPGASWKLEQEAGATFTSVVHTLQSFSQALGNRRKDYPAVDESEHWDTACWPGAWAWVWSLQMSLSSLVQASAPVPLSSVVISTAGGSRRQARKPQLVFGCLGLLSSMHSVMCSGLGYVLTTAHRRALRVSECVCICIRTAEAEGQVS